MHNPFSLENKTILITGASSGIGKATAIECSKMGANLIIIGRNEERLKSTFELLDVSLSQNHSYYIVDLQNEDEVKNLTESVESLNGVVNCAGVCNPMLFRFESPEKIHKTMDSNFISTAVLMNMLWVKKKITKGASVVIISSIAGNMISYLAQSIYSASKAALAGFSKGLAIELASKNIRVNTVMPGMVKTNILNNTAITEAQLKEDEKKYPLKRYGNPEDVAYAVIYLLSDASSWVTGTDLVIDGGFTLQ